MSCLEEAPLVRSMCLALACCVWFASRNGLDGVFVLDDATSVVQNEALDHPWSLNPWSGRPLVELSFAANRAIGGLDPRGYHVVNVLVHGAATVTLFGLVRRTLLLPLWGGRYQGRASWLGFSAALLWGLHPLQTGSVTYIVQRAESLAGFCYLLMLYGLARGAEAGGSHGWFALSVAACLAGMGTKQVMATAPVMALLFDRTFLARSFEGALRERGAVHASLASTWLWLAAHLLMRPPDPTAGFAIPGVAWWQYLATQPSVLLHYLRLALWPDVLVLDYGWPLIASWREAVVPALVVSAALALTLCAVARRPAAGFLGAVPFIVLAPTSSLFPLADVAFEHRTYLPLAVVAVGVVLAAESALLRCFGVGGRAWRVVGALLLTAVAGTLAWRTALRNEDYRHGLVLWARNVAATPGNARARTGLGLALLEVGRPDLAEEQFAEAVRLRPAYADGLNNLGALLAARGRVLEARGLFERAVRADPSLRGARDNLARVVAAGGRSSR